MVKYSLYSYTLDSDSGFAPNPFGKICTLACCKPVLRRSIGNRVIENWKKEYKENTSILDIRNKDDRFIRNQNIWVVGIAGRNVVNRKNEDYRNMIYLMHVTDIIDFETYFNSKSFENKKPKFNNKLYDYLGDNIYDNNDFNNSKQMKSLHSNNFGDKHEENEEMKQHDLSGLYVLISDEFFYFGDKPKEIPKEYKDDLKIGNGHKINHSIETIKWFQDEEFKQIDNPVPYNYTEPDNLGRHCNQK